MEWVILHLPTLAAGASLVASGWAIARRFEARMKGHLGLHFASRRDLARLENKIDVLYRAVVRREHRAVGRSRVETK